MKNIEKSYIDIIVDLKNRLSELEKVEQDKKFWMDYAVKRDMKRNEALDMLYSNENDSEEVKVLKKQIREVLV
jgi:hypothetical protein|nr:MAG TPA: hypothetical protein [Caudoviricetes sp.]